MTSTPNTHRSALQRLRSVVPSRDSIKFDEALRVAELQAALLVDLVAGPDGVREVEIAGQPRIAVHYEPLAVSGMSHWNGREWIITIARDDSPVRQRFTLLHEFKHVVDHGHTSRLYRGDLRYSSSEQAERAADYFAGCALVPKRTLKSAWGSGMQRIGALANHFGVSEDAMAVRLWQTGLSKETDQPRQRSRCARPVSTSRRQTQRFRPIHSASRRSYS